MRLTLEETDGRVSMLLRPVSENAAPVLFAQQADSSWMMIVEPRSSREMPVDLTDVDDSEAELMLKAVVAGSYSVEPYEHSVRRLLRPWSRRSTRGMQATFEYGTKNLVVTRIGGPVPAERFDYEPYVGHGPMRRLRLE